MKKIFIFILMLASFAGFSQGVTIDATTYTPTQLVNEVLINSPCVSGSNVQSSTGTNFGSTNGIGYFTNVNPNFPFTRGVVLTTGDVLKVPSPNNAILSDGTNTWPGDADLEANLLAQSTVTINSINATYIEFDFVPKTPDFDFSFIFASEEYGTSQCNFSDAFAFLLRDLSGGPNTNLALVPPPSANIPISVETIRDMTYNDDCPSVNPSFFGAFNGPGFGPAINFNGQTIEMQASATGLDITHTYRIKIVIADGGDNVGYDSAIFLEANSFNVGQNVLGLDYITANAASGRDGICSGTPLPTLNAAGLALTTTFEWMQGTTVIVGETSSTLVLEGNANITALTPGNNTFSVTYNEPGCDPVTDEIIVYLYPAIGAIATVPPIYRCDTGAANYDFDLTKNTTIIMAGATNSVNDNLPVGTEITYYLTNAQAINGNVIDQLPTTYNISTSSNNLTIYVRIRSAISSCYEIRSFQLRIVPPVSIANMPANLTLCARNLTDGPPRANFDFNPIYTAILGLQDPAYTNVTFYNSQTNANAGGAAGIITPNPTTKILLTPTRPQVWIRVNNISDPTCFIVSSSSFSLTVTPLPLVDDLPDVVVCATYELPVLTEPGAEYWSGFTVATQTPVGPQLFAGAIIDSNKTIYVVNQSGSCVSNNPFKVTIADLPALVSGQAGNHCTQYVFPTSGYARFFTMAGGPGGGGVEKFEGDVITTPGGPQTIHVYFYDSINNCTVEESFDITVIPFVALPEYENQFGCTTYTLNADPNGATYYSDAAHTSVINTPANITTTTPIYVYKVSPLDANCNDSKEFTVFIGNGDITIPTDATYCTTHILDIEVGEYHTQPNGGGATYVDGDPVPVTTTFYYYIPGQPCVNNLPPFTITIENVPLPVIADETQCGFYILPPVAHDGDYFTGPNGTGTILPVGYYVTSTQTIYFYDELPDGTCPLEEEFLVTINPFPAIDARPIQVIKCNESYFLDDLTNGEYYDNQGGPANNPGGPMLPNTEIIADNTIYVYAASADPGNLCPQEYSIDILITNTQVTDIADQSICTSDPAYLSGLPAIVGPGDYYDAPNGPNGTGAIVSVGTVPPVGVTTYYVYAEDNNRVACSDEDVFTVTVYQTPVVDPITAPIQLCAGETYTLPAYASWTTTPPGAVTHYYSGPGGATGNTEFFPGDPITADVYIYADSGAGATVCFDEELLDIIVTPIPVITPAVGNVSGCDTVTLTALTVGTYYQDAAHTIPFATPTPSFTVGGPYTVWAYAEDATNTNCTVNTSFEVTVYQTPVIDPTTAVNRCSSDAPYILPPYASWSTTPPGAVTHYYSGPGGPVGNTELFPNDPITGSTTIYLYAATGAGSTLCPDEEPLIITTTTTPVINPSLPTTGDYTGCDITDGVTLPTLSVGAYYEDAAHTLPYASPTPSFTVAGPPITVYRYAESAANPACNVTESFTVTVVGAPVINPPSPTVVNACNSYTLPPLTVGDYYTDATHTTLLPAANYTITAPVTTVFVYEAGAVAGCDTSETYTVNVYNVDEPTAVTNCGTYQLSNITLLTPGAGFYGQSGGVNPITEVTTSGTVYVYGIGPSGCTDEYSFSVTILPNAVANPVPEALRKVCDADSNPDDNVTDFDLDSLTATILGAQNPLVYTVKYYPSQPDAEDQTNEIVTDLGTATDTNRSTVYVRVSDGTTSGCEDIQPLTIIVVPLPHEDSANPLKGTICTNVDTGQVYLLPPVIESGYSSTLYTFEWKDAADVVVSTAANWDYSAAVPGNYRLVITAQGLTACESAEIPVTIIESSRPTAVDFTTSGWFTDRQTITVTTTPPDTGGLFLYSLDGAEPQTTGVFTEVSSGVHEITVSDVNGCGSLPLPIPIQMVNSPKFFTPNGDGINDKWTIQGAANLPDSELFIYDRYGKLLSQQFLSNNSGWDGTVNGQPLPGSDYWFTIKYIENGVPMEFKSHFSLVR